MAEAQRIYFGCLVPRAAARAAKNSWTDSADSAEMLGYKIGLDHFNNP